MDIARAVAIVAVAPESLLVLFGCLALVLGTGKATTRRMASTVALVGILLVTLLVFWQYRSAVHEGAGFEFGPVSYFVRISGLVLGVLLTLASWRQAREGEEGEFYSMLLFTLAGLLLVAPADNLVLLFIALELVSIPTYVLVTLSRSNIRALEAGTKYFYLGAMAAAIMAYGFSFLYGVSGEISIADGGTALRAALDGRSGTTAQSLALLGVLLSLAGLFFKIAAVPLHFYIADVYEGSAHSVAGLLGFVPKLAGFIAIFKILSMTGIWNGGVDLLFVFLWIVAALSMTVGNVLAFMQDNLKRMLGYSGIAHSGYMLVAVLAGSAANDGGSMSNGLAAVLYYAVIYGIANLGAFLVLGVLRYRGSPAENLRDVAGLLKREPALALLLALSFLTLMGLPPTPGFWGKLSLFGSALSTAQSAGDRSTWLVVLVVVAVLNTAVGAAYYLRVVAAVLLHEQDEPAEADAAADTPSVGAFMCGVLLLIFSFYPNALLMSGLNAASPGALPPRVSWSSAEIPTQSPAASQDPAIP